MKNRRIYISLPITGLDENIQRQRALVWQRYFTKIGYEVVNPFDVYDSMCRSMGHEVEPTYEEIMGACLVVVDTCTDIFLIEGWDLSSGCCREAIRATESKLNIHFERTYKLS
jgi:hypothetical protein